MTNGPGLGQAASHRLQLITQRVGFTLWQLQELEFMAATCFALMAKATKGMGIEAGTAVLNKELRQTFGMTVRALGKASLLDAELEKRIQALLEERNWLVHRSKVTNRDAIHSDAAAARLLQRVDVIVVESSAVSTELVKLAERFAKRQGIDATKADANALQLLEQWQCGEA